MSFMVHINRSYITYLYLLYTLIIIAEIYEEYYVWNQIIDTSNSLVTRNSDDISIIEENENVVLNEINDIYTSNSQIVLKTDHVQYKCPTCGRVFSSYEACHTHVVARKHNKGDSFCLFDPSGLPQCENFDSEEKRIQYGFGVCSLTGRVNRMEDIYWVSDYDLSPSSSSSSFSPSFSSSSSSLNVTDTSAYIYGLSDGHMGTTAATFLAEQIERYLLISSHNRLPSPESVEEAYAKAREKWEHIYCKEGDVSGSTSTIVIKSSSALLVANIGDSIGYLCCDKENQFISITREHRVTDPREQSLILRRGGVVKGGRIAGQLALSRSFGDCAYIPYISITPFIFQIDIDHAYHKYIILASDGVWDYLTGDEVHLYKSILEEVATYISKEAYSRGSMDNISTMIIAI
ncbi:hypothetical protein WA158_003768 [Blastocystis sp. Blastoise]